ncbi:WD40-repeat-containing domain protein [Rhypophila decipiens]
MAELDPASAALPPPKRRRVDDGSADTTPRYSSPSSDTHRDPINSSRDNDEPNITDNGLSIRRGRPHDRSRSRSRSRSANDERKRYRSASPSSSRPSRLRSRSRRRSRSPYSSRSRSRSRSHSRSRSSSTSRRRRHSNSRSRSSSSRPSPSRRLSPSALQLPLQDAETTPEQPPPRPPLKPRYRRILELRGHELAVSQVRISPDGKWIASASADGTARIWDAHTGEHLETLVGHMQGISCIAWAPDSNTLATGSDDKAIRLWDRVTASPAHSDTNRDGSGSRGAANGVVTGARAKNARSGAALGTRVVSTRCKGPLLGHHNYVYCLAFSPKGNILASGSYDEAVFLWDVRAGRLMRSLPAHSDPVSGIDFCRDGTLVVSCSTDGLIRIWDTSTGQCLRTLVHEDNPPVTNVCFSPNGRFVLAFSLDSSIRLWDFVSGTVKKTYQGHLNKGYSIGGSFAVLPEDEEDAGDRERTEQGQMVKRCKSFVVSPSEDGDVVLWDVTTKEIVQRLKKVHDQICFWVDVRGDTMVSSGNNGVIVVFKHKPPRREKEKKREANGANGHVNGVAGEVNVDGPVPYETAADNELQRQVKAEAGSPPEDLKEEPL